MRKNVALLLLSMLILTSCLTEIRLTFSSTITENTWVSKTPMNVARANLGVAVVNGDIYAIGGNTISGEYNQEQGFYAGFTGRTVNTTEQYNPSTDTWSFKASMPTARDSFAVAVYQNEIYCIGGRLSIPYVIGVTNDVITNVNEVYNPANNTWQTKAAMPDTDWPLEASVVNGIIYVIDGSGGVYAYNPANDSWTTMTPAPSVNSFAVSGFVTTVFDGRIYVFGINDLDYVYYPSNNTWNVLNSTQSYNSEGLLGYGGFEEAGGATTGILAPERIYVFFENQTMIYNPADDSWTSGDPMPIGRVDFGVAVINDTFYAVGGSNIPQSFFDTYGPTATNEQYLPVGYGTPDPSYVLENTSPKISVLSPLNQTYNKSYIPLLFTANKAVDWMGYSLNGQQNVTLTGNGTIINLKNGLQNVTVYANDTFGNMGASTVSFTVAGQGTFPTSTVAAVSVAAVVVIGVVLALIAKKRKR